MAKDWKDLREDVERLAYLYGIQNLARKVPVSRATVYRWLNNQVSEPHAAQKQAVERMVEESSHTRQPDDS